MPKPLLVPALFALVLIAGGAWAARAIAQDATPVAGPGAGATTLILVEHNDNETIVDLGEPGPSAGDMLVWGPNPLYDAANAIDTGATTQGTCVTLHAANACLAHETVIFPDGSTLEIQGVERGGGEPSARTIIAGSGQYLGATGTLSVVPTEDEQLWTKTFTIIQ